MTAKRNGAQGPSEPDESFVYHVNLDDIAESKLTVTLKGKQYPVKPIDGAGFEILSRLNKNSSPIQVTEIMYQLGATCLEGSDLDARSLTPAQIAEVVKLSANGARMVEGIANPNSERPAARRNRAKSR